MSRISYQGTEGAYSYIAAKYLMPDATLVGQKTFEDVYESVIKGETDYALLPSDNTLIGSIFEVYDLLYSHPTLYIVSEVRLKIDHNLLGLGNVDEVKKAYSHPKALAQCNTFFKNNPGIKGVVYEDTAKAAQLIAKKGNSHLAAIASLTAAHIYGLKVLKPKIQNNDHNFTRFVLLGKSKELLMAQVFKTSLVFVSSHKPGSLLSALQPFAKHGINLTKIESRPLVGSPWEYLFYLDFEHNKLNGEMEAIISEVKPHTKYLRQLGTYEKGVTLREKLEKGKVKTEKLISQ